MSLGVFPPTTSGWVLDQVPMVQTKGGHRNPGPLNWHLMNGGCPISEEILVSGKHSGMRLIYPGSAITLILVLVIQQQLCHRSTVVMEVQCCICWYSVGNDRSGCWMHRLGLPQREPPVGWFAGVIPTRSLISRTRKYLLVGQVTTQPLTNCKPKNHGTATTKPAKNH